ncbi:PfaD family polyunsaturated fatty acid/polyketide biosynthesis protein [Nocardia sp. R6R-6]|uniref:PfaD family polyunsaturated fatty acid/polyketide biosynthesis protein n=1 Tax=Nocardia sp. R6R-6 TaxID=3459303 RepID=UPI00403DECF1
MISEPGVLVVDSGDSAVPEESEVFAADSAQWLPAFSPDALLRVTEQPRTPVGVVVERSSNRVGLTTWGSDERFRSTAGHSLDLLGSVPALYPEWLGDRSFCVRHDVRFPYIAGEMAGGIATTRMVCAMAQADMLAFFGAAGLAVEQVEAAVAELAAALAGRRNWGVNLIHSPTQPQLEEHLAELMIARGVPIVSVSAFTAPTPAVVRLAAAGLTSDRAGRIVRRTKIIAKVSHPDVAERFLCPPAREILEDLRARQLITPEEAHLAQRVPVAEDLTVEGDSGGHTDNRPLAVVLPVVSALRDQLVLRFGYEQQLLVGAAGGLGTPESVAAAFALGAAYVVTGSVNQVAVESGLSDDAKALLAAADVADVVMAPSADMFELGGRVQVLRRGTMFAQRASRLWEVFRAYDSIESVPTAERDRLERMVLHETFDALWARTATYWRDRDPAELERAARDPRHRMALAFRTYLGLSSRWAVTGHVDRRTDYQIWCGPAMGAFNRWTRGSFLGSPERRSVVQIARNLMEGAAVVTRRHQLRSLGVPVPVPAFAFRPRPLA